MATKVQYAVRDFDGDKQTETICMADALGAAGALTLTDAMDLWSAGAVAGHYYAENIRPDTGNNPSNPVAQGSLQAIVEMIDDTNGRAYIERIPIPNMAKADDGGANPAFIRSGGLTVFNPDHADYATLETALTGWESPNGNSGTLSRVYIEE